MPPGKYECYAYLENSDSATASSLVEIGPGKRVDLGDLLYTRQNQPKVGRPAPAELAIGLDGRPIRTADFAGKTLVVAFWWSIPGNSEQQKLADLSAKLSARSNLAILAINVDRVYAIAPRRPPQIGSWITAIQPGLPSDWGSYGQIAIITPDGKIAADEVAADQVESTLDKLK